MRSMNRFSDKDDAVSPVIGVILMVAITVILAAVVAVFVLGMAEDIDDNVRMGVTFDQIGGDTVDVMVIDSGNADTWTVNCGSNAATQYPSSANETSVNAGSTATCDYSGMSDPSGEEVIVLASTGGTQNVVNTYTVR